MSTEPITGLTYQEAGSLQTDAVQNAELNFIGAWLNCVVLSVGDNDPPGSPAEGDCYIVGDTPTGAWATHADDLAVYRGGWQFFAPKEGVAVKDLDSGNDYEFVAAAWTVKAGGGGAVSSVNGATGAVVLDDGDVKSVVTALTSGTTVTVDCSLGRNFTLTLGHNVGTLTLSNLAGAGYVTEFELEIKQPASGGPYTFALPAAFKALGGSDTAIASAANAVTVLSAKTFDNGTTWRYAMQESA